MTFEWGEQQAQQLRNRAEALIGDPMIALEQALEVARLLQQQCDYDLARRLLLAAAAGRTSWVAGVPERQLGLQLALCTYQDEQLPPARRFHMALEWLDGLGLHDPACRDAAVLAQGGAIYRRQWECEGQIEPLLSALACYRAGWERNPEDDLGHCALQAAFLLDVLAERARALALGAGAAEAQAHAESARRLREDILMRLPAMPGGQAACAPRYPATLGEAAWGLRRWAQAADWFAQVRASGPDEQMLQGMVKQLIAIAHFQGVALAPASATQVPGPRMAIEALLGAGAVEAALSAHRGKVGLALSGGGFRAALYHLGVLARLAECDALRSVQVISTVSGGSIIGAHYYLALRKLLESRADQTITAADYVSLIRALIPQFLSGVQKNLRVRTFASAWHNLKMFRAAYTRSNRIGELYDDYLFRAVSGPGGADGGRCAMDELRIEPAPAQACAAPAAARFQPGLSNWRRSNKVPVLTINATSLNSGHNWHFTASAMGEPPGQPGERIDVNPCYRRLSYRQAPTAALRKFPLAYAVAASAGVPALFAPLPLTGLYPDRTVELVDGGVHDNQGVAGLLDAGCNIILCSDGSGQIEDQARPAENMLGVFFRSDTILQSRVRQAQLQDLSMRVKSRALQGLFYVHLKQELDAAPLSWIGCDAPPQPPQHSSRTSYGVDRAIQQSISEIRTDLDSFTEVEAYALMASGYLATAHQLEQLDAAFQRTHPGQRWGGFQIDAPRADRTPGAGAWPFAPLFELIALPPDSADVRRRDLGIQLKVARAMFGKVWILSGPLRGLAAGAGAAALAALLYEAVMHAGQSWTWAPVWHFSMRGILAAVFGIGLALAFPVTRFVRIRKAGESWLVKGLAASFGMLACHVHLLVFDRLFLRRGSLARLLRLGRGAAAGRPARVQADPAAAKPGIDAGIG